MSLDWGIRRDDRPAPEDRAQPRRRTGWRARIAQALVIVISIPLVLTAVYAFVPPVSTLMLARWATLRPVTRDWVPMSAISENLPRAVIASEDAFFCAHTGVDWGAILEVLSDPRGPQRGASTITMQVAKNLFLFPEPAVIRKPVEIALAHWLELAWSKRRIMEVYLNVAEWGPNGIFGAEAAARRAFRKPASALTQREASILAAALPNPIVRNTARPGPRLTRRAGRIMTREGDTSCLGF